MRARAPKTAGGAAGQVARIAGRIRERGFAPALRKAFDDHVFRRSTSVIVEYRIAWQKPVGPNAALPDGLCFVEIARGDALPPLCDWMAWRRNDFVAMLEAGKIAIFALADGVAVGCVWLSLTDHHDARSREHYRVGPDEAYHYCWMIDPARRRTNIGIPLCREVMNRLAARGIVRQFGVVDRVNRASYLIQLRFGYRECGVQVIHYYILGTRWTRLKRYEGVLGTIARKAAHEAVTVARAG